MSGYGATFARIAKSKFRSRFHLSGADRKFVSDKGLKTIRSHCEDFIRTRLAPANPPNDGKQTPMRGHPVFKAQHVCACCCRDCLAKWWRVPRGVEIPTERQRGIVDFLMAWIELVMVAKSRRAMSGVTWKRKLASFPPKIILQIFAGKYFASLTAE